MWAYIDTCEGQGLYFLGHDTSNIFAPLDTLGVGDTIDYWNSSGAETVYVVTRVVVQTWPQPIVWYSGAAAEFQTCDNATGSIDRILITNVD